MSKSGKKADTELDLEVYHLQGPSVEDSAVNKLQKELNELKEKLGIESQKPERQYGGQITSPYSKIFHTIRQVFVEWSRRVDLNVYNKVFDYDNVLVKFFWLVILLASLAALVGSSVGISQGILNMV